MADPTLARQQPTFDECAMDGAALANLGLIAAALHTGEVDEEGALIEAQAAEFASPGITRQWKSLSRARRDEFARRVIGVYEFYLFY
ncbi:MAG TPA: hypothetical protein VGC56_09705 [Allosphingosinicella sp.]|jgi:hypothetical protein